MNLCFLIGKVISEVKYEFMYESKYISIASLEIELSNKVVIKITGYDDIADYMYRKVRQENLIHVFGKVFLQHIEVENIQVL